MRENFEIRPSRNLLVLVLSSHGLTGLVIFFYLEPGLLKLSACALVLLLAIHESKRLFQQEIINLALDPRSAEIEVRQGGQPYFYSKYKVYATRWFAILKLVDDLETRTLILNPERFESEQCYRRLRYFLQRTECADAA